MTMPNEMPSHEIIDATQNAVLSVADSVSNAIENTAHGMEHGEVFYLSPEFWVGFSFILVVLGLARPVGKIVYKMLRKRSADIASRIDETTQLKEDAQKLLAEYEMKYRHAEQEAQEILARSEREINLLKKEKLTQLEQEMSNKEREALERINASQDKAMQEVAHLAASKAIQSVKAVLIQKLTDKDKDKMIDESINLVNTVYKS